MSIVEGNAFGDILKEFHPRQQKHGGIANRKKIWYCRAQNKHPHN
jgi:hypothetical protein